MERTTFEALKDNLSNDGKYLVKVIKGSLTFKKQELLKPREIILLATFVILAIIIVLLGGNHFYNLGSRGKVVSQNIEVNITSFKEQANLEVLQVQCYDVVVEKANENKDGIQAWTEFSGTGVFSINLELSEAIIDKARKTIIIRTPDVEMSNFTINYGNTKLLFFHNELANDSYRDGDQLASAITKEAYILLNNNISRNAQYYESARRAAETIISSLVKHYNPEWEVVVEVGVL